VAFFHPKWEETSRDSSFVPEINKEKHRSEICSGISEAETWIYHCSVQIVYFIPSTK
jgi:hypothetical protein